MSRVTSKLPDCRPTFVLELDAETTQELAGLIGNVIGSVGEGLYWELIAALEETGIDYGKSEAYKRGLSFTIDTEFDED